MTATWPNTPVYQKSVDAVRVKNTPKTLRRRRYRVGKRTFYYPYYFHPFEGPQYSERLAKGPGPKHPSVLELDTKRAFEAQRASW